jgi:hypothetical protein
VLLIHTSGMVNVCIHLTHIVKVSVRDRLGSLHLAASVQQDMQVVAVIQQLQSLETIRSYYARIYSLA